MNQIKTYIEWLNEDFGAVGVAPAGNIEGMGSVTPPTSTSIGSGDSWGGSAKPFSIRKKKPGHSVTVKGKKVKIKKHKSWTKNKQAWCMSFEGECEGNDVLVKFDKNEGYML